MGEEMLREQVLSAWIGLNSLLKDSRMTREMTYNEAVVMRLALERYREDGIGRTSVQCILKQTNMLKSQVNRTVNALCAQGYLRKEREGRSLYVLPVPERLPDFLAVHDRSLKLVGRIIETIGESDARDFVRICRKLAQADLRLGNEKGEEA